MIVIEPNSRVIVSMPGGRVRGVARAFVSGHVNSGGPRVQVEFDRGLTFWIDREKVRPVPDTPLAQALDATAKLRWRWLRR